MQGGDEPWKKYVHSHDDDDEGNPPSRLGGPGAERIAASEHKPFSHVRAAKKYRARTHLPTLRI
jgi:hypothetical protein